jgi:hypothetical protein
MNNTRTAHSPKENILDDQRGGKVPHVNRCGIRGYDRAYSERCLREEGLSGDDRASMGSYDCDVDREDMVEDVLGEFEASDSDKESRRFSRSTLSTSDSE